MMRLVIEHVGRSGARAGQLELRKETVLSTPLLLVSTRGGAVPHLTRETLGHIWPVAPPAVNVPYQWHVKQADVLAQFGGGVGKFLGLGESSVWVSVQDPGERTPSGYHTNNAVSVWTGGGGKNKEVIDAKKYMQGIQALRPDVFVSLCDGDTPADCSNKRLSKSVSKTVDFLDKCLDYKSEMRDLADTGIIGVIEGGRDGKSREWSAKQTAARPVDGFLLDGLHLNGEDAEKMAFEEIGPIVKDVLELLPEEKVRIMHGAFDPELVLDLVTAGVDVFDSSYLYLATERDSALVFDNKTNPGGKSDGDGSNGHLSCGHELLMTAPIHRSDMGPLLDGCDCYSCRKHTRAYIHHLLTVREMLGKVLLMIHNLHHYKVFFDTIREAIKRDSLQEVKDMIVQSKIL